MVPELVRDLHGKPRLVGDRVALRSQDRDQGRPFPDLGFDALERPPFGHRPQRLQEGALQHGEDDLGLGIPEAAVELHHLRPLVGEHEARVQEAPIGASLPGQAVEGRGEDLLPDPLQELGCGDGDRRVGPHPPGVQAGVALADLLVVLGRRQEHDVLAVGQGEDRELLALHEVLDHDHVSGVAEGLLGHDLPGGLLGCRQALAHQGALPAGEPRGLHHQRSAHLPDVLQGGLELPEGAVGGRGNADLGHEVLGECLAGLDPGGLGGGAEGGDPAVPQAVHHPRRQGGFGADDGQIDAGVGGPGGHTPDVRGREVHAVHPAVHAPVRARDVEGGVRSVPAELPEEGVLAPPVSDDQDMHHAGNGNRRPPTSGTPP